ncbi:neocarzinostatin apoprotein domain-containing protein [Nocardia takedensis]|uniref:neocarzinostatin apoprotein domain-containing protein n=1 Tax=Nocardia takedensis TaxID=259390 RepID=UPI0005933B30|nr:neocarzinostatin apoprotein domain-containing protein [Nocardia takedensis]
MGTRAVLGSALGATLLLCAAPAGAAPTLQVDARDGLTPGQSVSITLDGLPANMPMVAVGQCKPLVAGPADCDLPGSLMGAVDAAGVWRSTTGATAITVAPAVGGVDCTSAAGACAIAVTSLTDPTAILASVPLSFGKAEPAAAAPAQAAPAAEPETDYTTVFVGAGVVAVLAAVALFVFARRRAS